MSHREDSQLAACGVRFDLVLSGHGEIVTDTGRRLQAQAGPLQSFAAYSAGSGTPPSRPPRR